MHLARAAALAAVVVVAAGCRGGSTPPAEQTDAVAGTTTSSGPHAEEAGAGSDESAAVSFIDAWRRRDTDAMRRVGSAHPIDVAMRLGTAAGEPECSSQSSGQYQCIVGLTDGTRAYLLIGEPGARAGRVWWVGRYVPGA